MRPGVLCGAYGINARGQVVGVSETAASQQHAFLWERGTMADLGTLGGHESWAWGISTPGHVVGWSEIEPDSDVIHAFLWEDGTMTDLGTLGGDQSWAWGVNALGQVVGWSEIEPGSDVRHAFLWEKGIMTEGELMEKCKKLRAKIRGR